MISLDMKGLSEAELEVLVAQCCSKFGDVKCVKVLLADELIKYPVALVQMTTQAASDIVSAIFADSRYLSTVTIRLEQAGGSTNESSPRPQIASRETFAPRSALPGL
jgi:hypothetical protein